MFASFVIASLFVLRPASAVEGEMSKLAFLLGDWKSHEVVHRDGKEQSFDLDGAARRVMGGAGIFIEEKFELPKGVAHYNAILISYDKQKSTYRAWWHTADQTTPIEFVGAFEGKEFKLRSESSRLKITYSEIRDKSFHAQLFMELEGSWRVITDAHYTRKASSGI